MEFLVYIYLGIGIVVFIASYNRILKLARSGTGANGAPIFLKVLAAILLGAFWPLTGVGVLLFLFFKRTTRRIQAS